MATKTKGLPIVHGKNEAYGIKKEKRDSKDSDGRYSVVLNEGSKKIVVAPITSIEKDGKLKANAKKHLDNEMYLELDRNAANLPKRSAIGSRVKVVNKNNVQSTKKRTSEADKRKAYKHVYDNPKHQNHSKENRKLAKSVTRKKKTRIKS